MHQGQLPIVYHPIYNIGKNSDGIARRIVQVLLRALPAALSRPPMSTQHLDC